MRLSESKPVFRKIFAASSALIMAAVAFVALANLASTGGAAQTYSFRTNSETVDIHIMKDGSIDIDYAFNFTNYDFMDGVDVGLPNDRYKTDTATATIIVNGVNYAPAQIRKSPYVSIGLAVEFDSQTQSAIQSYNDFTLLFHVNNPHMVYENELLKGTVGIKFRPTWFSSDYQQGPTALLQSRIFFPEGFSNVSQTVYLENRPWNSIQIDEDSGLVLATWTDTNVMPAAQESGAYDVGAGFPPEYVDTYVKKDVWTAFKDFFGAAGDLLCVCAPILILAGIIAFAVIASRRHQRQSAQDYFEPKLSLAGAGPRRDLTAVEAAIALEIPLDMVATMILFALVKKGKLRIDSQELPMKLTKLAQTADYAYENDYLLSVQADGTVDHNVLKKTMVDLIEATVKKLEGFDYEATQNY